MRSEKVWPSASEATLTVFSDGRKRRLVLMFEWLTLWPTIGPIPVSSQRRDILRSSRSHPRYVSGRMKQVFAAGGPLRERWPYRGMTRSPSRLESSQAGDDGRR